MSLDAAEKEALVRTASLAAETAGRELLERWAAPREVGTKSGPTDLVTDADRASEEVLLGLIERRHPGARILAEESGLHDGSGPTWVVDPLDGTVNYAWGIPHFCVSVAVIDSGVPEVGVVYDPIRRESFRAIRGGGAWLGERRLRVNPCQALDDAILATGFSYYRAQRERHLPSLKRLLLKCRGLRRFGAAALDLAWVACGRLDGFWERALKPWDVAAGALLVTEAGGRVTGYDEAEDPLSSGRIVAAGRTLNALIREEIAAATSAR